MKTVLVDASSAILLYKVSLFEVMCDLYRVAMAATVIEEITVANHHGAEEFQMALDANRIQSITFQGKPDDAGSLSKVLGAGERETLLAYGLSRARFILIDDREGARACRRANIPHINALLCPEILYGAGWLQRQQRDAIFKRLLSIGRYGPQVVAYADNCRGEALAYFHPGPGRSKGIHM